VREWRVLGGKGEWRVARRKRGKGKARPFEEGSEKCVEIFVRRGGMKREKRGRRRKVDGKYKGRKGFV